MHISSAINQLFSDRQIFVTMGAEIHIVHIHLIFGCVVCVCGFTGFTGFMGNLLLSLCSRMGGIIRFGKMLKIEMGINLCRRDIRMAQ